VTPRASAPRGPVALALALVLALCALAGCGPRRAESCARQVDDATIAVLNTARALHEQADIFEAAGDYPAATRAIERVLALHFPHEVEESEDVRADAWGRMAELALAAHDPDRALANANTGLQDSHRDSVLRARLYVARGRALRALSERAQAAGDSATADARRNDALSSLTTSIEINQRVLGTLLDGGVH
jgi:hypothetical protein